MPLPAAGVVGPVPRLLSALAGVVLAYLAWNGWAPVPASTLAFWTAPVGWRAPAAAAGGPPAARPTGSGAPTSHWPSAIGAPAAAPPAAAGAPLPGRPSEGSNSRLVEYLVSRKLVQSDAVKAAMLAVDRAAFVRPGDLPFAYEDRPLPIGFGATISAPHMHALCLELLAPFLRPGAAALDVGSGSGYFAALMAAVAAAAPAKGPLPPVPGLVVGVEHIEALAEWSRADPALSCRRSAALPPPRELANTAKLSDDLRAMIILQAGDGRLGAPGHAPYAAIHVGAAWDGDGPPPRLLEQLAVGGRMVLPLADHTGQQYLTVVDRTAPGTVTVSKRFAVNYVPLTDREYYGP